MKNLILFVLLCFSFSAFSQSSLKGIWNTGEDNTKIEIYQSNEHWVGKIKSSDNSKAEIGKVILKDLKKNDDKWHGKLYAAKKKEWYDVTIVTESDVIELKINVGFFSKTIEWEKIK